MLIKKPENKRQLFEALRKSINLINQIMSILEKEPITKLEKWINRIVTAAIAIWQAVQYLLTHWQSKP
jgi:hypothetical protein